MLSDDVSEMPKNWNRRFKHNRDKIKTGDIYELAEVVRNLAVREQDKGLSTGEKQMYTRAKKILASEMMYALEKTEDEAEAYLDEILLRSADEAGGAPPRLSAPALRQQLEAGRASSVAPRAAANALGPAGPRRSSTSPGGPMLEWSLDALRAAGMAAGSSSRCPPRRRDARARGDCARRVVEGGATRSASVRSGARRRGRRRRGRRPRRRPPAA